MQAENERIIKSVQGKGTDIENSLGASLGDMYAGIAKVPRYIYDLASVPSNFIADTFNVPELRTRYEDVLNAAEETTRATLGGAQSPLTMLDAMGDHYQGKAQQFKDKQVKYDEDIIGSIGKGNWSDAGSQLVNNIVASGPSMLLLAMTDGAGTAGQLGNVSKTAINALPFASSKSNEIKDDESIPTFLKPIVSGMYGLSEVVFDQGFGSQAIIRKIQKQLVEDGAEVALKTGKDVAQGYIKKAFAGIKEPLTDMGKNAVEEMTTQFSQNLIDKVTNNPDKDLMDGVLEAGLVGGVQGGTLGGMSAVIGKSKESIAKKTEAINKLADDLDNPNIPPTTKEILNDKIGALKKEVQDEIAVSEKEFNSLDEKGKEKYLETGAKIDEIEKSMEAENISEEAKSVLTEQKKVLETELDKIKPSKEVKVIDEVITPTEAVKETEAIKEIDKRRSEAVNKRRVELAEMRKNPTSVFKTKSGQDATISIRTGDGKPIETSSIKNQKDFVVDVEIGKQRAGSAVFKIDSDGNAYSPNVSVSTNFRRNGIASNIYDYVESLGFDIKPSDSRVPEGKRMWENLNTESAINERFNREIEALNPKEKTKEITEDEYSDYVAKGIVTDERINLIADKIRDKKELTWQEKFMVDDKNEEIEKVISNNRGAEIVKKGKSPQKTQGLLKDKQVIAVTKEGDSHTVNLSDVKIKPNEKLANLYQETKDPEYDGRFDIEANGNKIGEVELEEKGSTIQIGLVELYANNKGKGIGSATYIQLAEYAKSKGKSLTSSNAEDMNEQSTAVWRNFEKEGLAVRSGEGDRAFYTFTGLKDSEKTSEEVLNKAEDDLKALKQVTDKTKKYDAMLNRITEAKNNKSISTKEFDELKQRFDDVMMDSKQSASKFALEEVKKGNINWDGDRFTPRPELGMEWVDIRKGQADLLAGKDTPASKRLVEAINKAKEEGGYNFVQGSGAITNKMFVPLDSDMKQFELTEKENKEIAENTEVLAKEYDDWFNGLSEEEKTEETKSIENGNTETNQGTESKENVQDKETPSPTRIEQVKSRQQAIKDRISEKLKASRGNLSIGFDPSLLPDFIELGASYIEEGVVRLEDFIKRFREDVKGLGIDDISDEDIKNEIFSRVGESTSTDKLFELAHDNIESDEIRQTFSNRARETGKELTQEEKDYNAQTMMDSLRHGVDIVNQAKEDFGDEYPVKLLNFVKDNAKTLPIDKQSLILLSLENDLEQQLNENPKDLTLKKQQKLVTNHLIKMQRSAARATAMGFLRRMVRLGYDINKVTESFFTPKQQEAKQKIVKAVESTSTDVQEEYETQQRELEDAITEGVEKRVNEIYESLPSARRIKADKAIAALDRFQKKLRSKTYDASIGLPVAIIDAGITTIKSAIKAGVNIVDAIELGIKTIKDKYGEKWDKEDEFRKDMLDGFNDEGIKTQELEKTLKDQLIDAGYGREITVNTKDGKQKRSILDWKKLTGEEGSLDRINEVVDKVLPSKGYSEAEIAEVKQSLKDEYNSLHASIIEKAEKELSSRNQERTPTEIKSSAKRLAELYNYGLFEKDSDTYDKLINSAVGLSKIGNEAFMEAKDIARAIAKLYTQRDSDGQLMPEITFKKSLSDLNSQIEALLTKVSNTESNWKYKAVDAIGEFMGLSQRNALVSASQMVENTLSGYVERMFMDIGYRISNNTDTKALRNKRGELASAQIADIIYNAGNDFGDVTSPFLTKSKVMDKILNPPDFKVLGKKYNLSDSQIYHGITATAMGRAFLEGADSMHKIALTEKYFTYNLVKVLRKKGMPNQEAINFVSDKLTGQSFEDAKVQAKELVNTINEEAGKPLLSTKNDAVLLLANDIVKNALLVGNKLTVKELEASKKAAYMSAGWGLGHEANNMLSEQITATNTKIQGELKKAIKDKDWGQAVNLRIKSIIMNNVMNPFVGGGTNWMFLTAEKAGINPLSWYRALRKVKDIDISTDAGIRDLSNDLFLSMKRRNSAIRTLVGMGIGLSVYVAAQAGEEPVEEFAKWLKKNPWAQKYFDKTAPTTAMFMIAKENDDLMKFFRGSLNVKDRDYFSDGKKIYDIMNNTVKGNYQKATGALGELIGSKVNTPIIPWRVLRDEKNIERGLNGLPQLKSEEGGKGFLNGFFKGGFAEFLGLRPQVKDEANSEEDIEKKRQEAMKE